MLQNFSGCEILRRDDCIGGVVEGRPEWEGAVLEDEVAGVVERGGRDAEVGGGGVPYSLTGAIEEAEGAGGEEMEGSAGVNRNGGSGPDGDAAGVEDGEEEGGW